MIYFDQWTVCIQINKASIFDLIFSSVLKVLSYFPLSYKRNNFRSSNLKVKVLVHLNISNY